MTGAVVYLILGAALLLAVALPRVLHRQAVSAPLVLVVVGALIGLFPLPAGVSPAPVDNRVFVEHLTEFTVIVALMGVGLALDRPLLPTRRSTWRDWALTWRLLGVVMPLCIAAVAFLGWWAMGLAPAAALLLGAVLAPTDPVLASDVQVGGPTPLEDDDEEHDDLDEDDEVRFALTSEAGLNDGLAFPFVYAAVLLATAGGVLDWGARWLAWELAGKIVLGVLAGAALGWLLGRVAFRSPAPSLRLAETGEPLLALAAVLTSYGLAEARGRLRLPRGVRLRGHPALGGAGAPLPRAHAPGRRAAGATAHPGRPAAAGRLPDQRPARPPHLARRAGGGAPGPGAPTAGRGRRAERAAAARCRTSDPELARRERLTTAFFGVRGVGSLYYLAYATGVADFGRVEELWATVGFTVVFSVLVHGVAATPAMAWLDRVRDARREALPVD